MKECKGGVWWTEGTVECGSWDLLLTLLICFASWWFSEGPCTPPPPPIHEIPLLRAQLHRSHNLACSPPTSNPHHHHNTHTLMIAEHVSLTRQTAFTHIDTELTRTRARAHRTNTRRRRAHCLLLVLRFIFIYFFSFLISIPSPFLQGKFPGLMTHGGPEKMHTLTHTWSLRLQTDRFSSFASDLHHSCVWESTGPVFRGVYTYLHMSLFTLWMEACTCTVLYMYINSVCVCEWVCKQWKREVSSSGLLLRLLCIIPNKQLITRVLNQGEPASSGS